LSPGDLDTILSKLKLPVSPNLIVGSETKDDGAVFKITDDVALIQTLDFFTPVTDDPFLFGVIAATNALSDVYAMGGIPLTAMNIVCFPATEDFEILHQILAGAASKCLEADCAVVGGHSVDDKLVKFGLSVTGKVHPEKIWQNSRAREGDLLILTKAIGTGIVITAALAEMVEKAHIDKVFKEMSTLNKYAANCALSFTVNSCTDVTGFGLGGHLIEMAVGSKKTFLIDSLKIPVTEGAIEYASFGLVPGGAWKNQKAYECSVHINSLVTGEMQNVLFDPQTSGGLLFSVPAEHGEDLVQSLKNEGMNDAAIIGEVTPFKGKSLILS
jgi:selenide,water dikinase